MAQEYKQALHSHDRAQIDEVRAEMAGTAHATTRHSPPMAAIPGELTRSTSARTIREHATAPTPKDAATSPATAADRPIACTAGAT